MALSNDKKIEYTRRILMSRMRILCDHGFYGLLLMHMKFQIDESCETACTDGIYITFNPKFMDDLSDSELDFILMHEVLHVVLRHCERDNGRDPEMFNIACDIVVNSNILHDNGMDIGSITLKKYGESMHTIPSGEEGYDYTAEEVYDMVFAAAKKGSGNGSCTGRAGSGAGATGENGTGSGEGGCSGSSSWDDHSKWHVGSHADNEDDDKWNEWLREACESVSIQNASKTAGNMPLCAKRRLEELKQAQTDWRTILDDFVQEEIVDYSFNPPDRRFEDTGFFLPDFNDTEETVKDILFMIDTSGSMSDDMITRAYSEVKGAVDQFNGKLTGWLGFFDAAIVQPKEFENEDEFKIIRPEGGGGTNFHIIFKYVRDKMTDKLPASIIILTDGYADFPEESAAMGIPVLWMINNEEVNPPWGKVARIKE